MITPEMMIAAMNSKKAPPALAMAPSMIRPASLRYGIRLFNTPLRLSDADSQRAYTRGPTSGQVATDSGGAGTLQAPLLSSATRLSTDWPRDTTTR